MKKSAIAAVTAIGVVAALAGCSGTDGGSSDGSVELVFRQFDPANQIEGLEEAIDTWNEENPDIQVTLETLSPDNPQQFAREANSGSGPDIQQVAFANVALLASPKILLPLDELMESDPLEPGIDDFLATNMTTIDGTTWGIPWTADTMALVYNPEILAEYGVDEPPTTWEDFATASQTIADESDGATQGFCFAASSAPTSAQWFPINYYLWDHGWNFIEEDGDDWTTGVSASDLASTIDYFDEMFSSGASSEANIAVTDYADPQIAGALSDGTCAMSYAPPQSFRALEASTDTELLTAPMPGGLTDGSTHLGGRSLGINRNTEHPEEAWKVVKFLTSATTFETYQQYPASAATLTTLDVPESETGYTEQLPHSVAFGKYIGSDMPLATIQQLVVQQFSAVYSGQSSSETAAEAILAGLDAGIGG